MLELLLAFSPARCTMSARELAGATDIPLPTVYRYVALLRGMGLLVERGGGAYALSARLIPLAQAAEAADSLIATADPVMRRLAERVGETVILVRLLAGAAVCVHRIESRRPLRISFEPGQPLPLHAGASARLLLASLPAAARDERLAELRARDPGRAARLAAEVQLATERGWATSEEEIDRGIWAAAAAVRDGGATVASLSVPSPLVRAPESERERLLQHVRAAAAEIGEALTQPAGPRPSAG